MSETNKRFTLSAEANNSNCEKSSCSLELKASEPNEYKCFTNDEVEIETEMMEMLAKRGPEKTCCPSEVARKVCPNNWRSLMDPTRQVAQRLASAGKIDICQKGQVVTSKNLKGPIRLRFKKQGITNGVTTK